MVYRNISDANSLQAVEFLLTIPVISSELDQFSQKKNYGHTDGYCERGLYHAPVIPAGIRQNPVELFLAESPAKIAIPGTIYSGGIEPFCNWDRNGPRMDQNRIQQNAVCINDKSTMHTPSGMFLSNMGVHRALKMT